MVTSLSQSHPNSTIGFSVFDQLSCFDGSLRFGRVLSADRVREMFADRTEQLRESEAIADTE